MDDLSCTTTGLLPWLIFLYWSSSCLDDVCLAFYCLTALAFSLILCGIVYVSLCCCFSVPQSFLTLCDPMDCSTPAFPVLPYLPEFAQTHVRWASDTTLPSHPLSSPSPPAFNISPASGSFPMTQLFASGGQTTGASASALVLPMNIQGSFPLGLTGIPVVQGTLKSLLSTTVQKH